MPPWVGYYYAISRYGDHLAAASVGMNWAHLDIAQTHELLATIEVAKRCELFGVQACYSIVPILFIPQTLPLPYVLHPNWRERFEYQRPWFDAFAYRGGLHSLYIADEPTAHGVSAQDLGMVCEYIRDHTPYRTMIVEEMGKEANPVPPADYHGLTCWTPRTVLEAQTGIVGRTHVNACLVQGFNENPLPIPDQWAWYLTWKLMRYRVGAGMAFFLYPNYQESHSPTDIRSYTGAQGDSGTAELQRLIARVVREEG